MANLGLVDVIVVAFVWTPDDHDNKVLFSVETKVVDGRPEKMPIFSEPLGKVDGREEAHGDESLRLTRSSNLISPHMSLMSSAVRSSFLLSPLSHIPPRCHREDRQAPTCINASPLTTLLSETTQEDCRGLAARGIFLQVLSRI